MKSKLFKITSLFVLLALQSCSLEVREDNDRPKSADVFTGTVITGTITKNTTVTKGNYSLEGVVKVADGVTLTIEAGTNITAKSSVGSSLVVLKGGKINAQGTTAEPIVFTSDNKRPGDWGGLTIYGNAPIKANNGSATALSEDGNNQTYGGNDSNDNSGVMKFVRVEYGGRKIGDGTSETNSFTFYAVGAGTVLENLVAFKGTDDGFEFFGGSVSTSNLVSYGNFDDAFDWQDNWTGQNNGNWFAFQTNIGNFGMEIEASANADNTAPKVNGITLIREAGTLPEVTGSAEISAIQFKKQGSGIFNNVYIDGYKNVGSRNAFAVLIQDTGTETAQVLTNKIRVNPLNVINSDNMGVWGYAFTPNGAATYVNDTNVRKVTMTAGLWANVNGTDLLTALR